MFTEGSQLTHVHILDTLYLSTETTWS